MPKELLYNMFHRPGGAKGYLAAVSTERANARIVVNVATYAMLRLEHHIMCNEGTYGLATFVHRLSLHRQRD